MKRFLMLSVIGLLLWSGWYIASNCYPVGVWKGEQNWGCPTPTKMVWWAIRWQDGTIMQIQPWGTGQCLNATSCLMTYTPVQCWPAFDSPIERNGSWQQNVWNMKGTRALMPCGGSTITCVTAHSYPEGQFHREYGCTNTLCKYHNLIP